MKKTLLTERFQQLAGIKPLYELDEAANTNLELKSAARKLFQNFKKAGARVQLTNQQAVMKGYGRKIGDDGSDMDNVDVLIYIDEEYGSDRGAVGITLIGDKAIGFENKIKQSFPQFRILDTTERKTWGGKPTKELKMLNKGGASDDKRGPQQTTE
jgi:hypothetical protein